MPIEMKVSGLMVDPLTNMPIVILKNEAGDRLLPIWIGPFEAQAIAMKREGVEPPRPMTHDLLQTLLHRLGASLERVVITDLRDDTFYAVLHLKAASLTLEIDSRPSDAIALALRTDSPIFVEPVVLERSKAIDGDDDDESEESKERLRKWFEDVDTSDFSKYQM